MNMRSKKKKIRWDKYQYVKEFDKTKCPNDRNYKSTREPMPVYVSSGKTPPSPHPQKKIKECSLPKIKPKKSPPKKKTH
jgi:hypothetical protein